MSLLLRGNLGATTHPASCGHMCTWCSKRCALVVLLHCVSSWYLHVMAQCTTARPSSNAQRQSSMTILLFNACTLMMRPAAPSLPSPMVRSALTTLKQTLSDQAGFTEDLTKVHCSDQDANARQLTTPGRRAPLRSERHGLLAEHLMAQILLGYMNTLTFAPCTPCHHWYPAHSACQAH